MRFHYDILKVLKYLQSAFPDIPYAVMLASVSYKKNYPSCPQYFLAILVNQ